MNLHQKTLAVLGITILGLVGILSAFSTKIVMRGFSRLEDRSVMIAFLIIFGIVLVSVTLALMEKLILSRVIQLSREVIDIGANYETKPQVSVLGNDELSKLAVAINQMLKVLSKKTNELERSNRDLNQYANVASHDLQEPLRKILVFGERLSERAQNNLDEMSKNYLERMCNAAARMKSLVESLLDYARVGRQARPFQNVNLQKVAKEVLSDMDGALVQSQGKIEMGILPSIAADPVQMRQLFQNLISNALKYHRKGEAPRVRLESRPLNGHYVQILVEDNGVGMDENGAKRIFKPFQRLHSREEFEGTGIGLAICKKVAEQHGGDIEVKSALGKGSTFIVTLRKN